MYHRWMIENLPLQIYASSLVFSPAKSLTRRSVREGSAGLDPGKATHARQLELLPADPGRSQLPRCWPLHSHLTAASSRQGQRVTIGIWDAGSGNSLLAIPDDGYSISFSPDSSKLASVACNSVVKVWNAKNADYLCKFEHYGAKLVAFSPNSEASLGVLRRYCEDLEHQNRHMRRTGL